ncbi:MAG: tail fiber domain-containing protein, partial [Bacteroidota bacterium]|nr:tail fiber domain-containing protein [Bacteroidota bacterium]
AVGLASRVEGATTNYGGRFNANGATGVNYGIRASATGSGPGPNYAGWFDGDVIRTGTDNFTSDQNLKQNIDTISNVLNSVNLLLPKTFFFDTIGNPNMGLSSRKQWGFIAQDVETILPELVSEATRSAEYDSLGNVIEPALTFKTLNYNAFIAILMKGMQEQQTKIDSLSLQMANMQSQVNGCCSNSARTQNPNANQTDVTLTSAQSIVLNQNVPNPFAEQTTITYNLPESVTKAQLLFYDATGKLIKAVDLTGRGEGQINVFANDLSSGIYSYALVVDGQVADTKRMVKTQ